MSLAATIGERLGWIPQRLTVLAGGCVGEVWLAEGGGGERVVCKVGGSDARLDVEGAMLRYLAAHTPAPVPAVLVAEPGLLAMEWLPGSPGCARGAQEDAARCLAAVHEHVAEAFGFEHDTPIGGLRQPNSWCDSWLEFFADRRLLHMARAAFDAGQLGSRDLHRLERIAGRLGEWLAEPDRPRLLHGDLWSGNVLSAGGRLTGLIDPAIYFGHPEVELAFTTLFGGFGDEFYRAYEEHRPLGREFFAERRHVYNLYPLLVHARLFGGSYRADVEAVLDRFA